MSDVLMSLGVKWRFPELGGLGGTSKSSMLVAFSILNHPFWCKFTDGTPQMPQAQACPFSPETFATGRSRLAR